MGIRQSTILEESVRRLFPNMERDQALAELLLERAQKNLVKYELAARRYQEKYGQNFDGFRQKVLSSQPNEQTEQDYFDWELAVTGAADMRDEIERLSQLVAQQ